MSALPVRVMGLDHVVLRCTRLQATLAFYCDVLGCVLERSVEEIGLYQLRAGAALIDLVHVGRGLGGATPPRPDAVNMHHLCLRIARPQWSDIETHLAHHGVPFEAPARRYGADGFGLSVYVRDPEGNVVELKGPPRNGPNAAAGASDGA